MSSPERRTSSRISRRALLPLRWLLSLFVCSLWFWWADWGSVPEPLPPAVGAPAPPAARSSAVSCYL